MAWIDYKKAFDSVPHSWIIDSLHIYKVSPTIIGFLERAMRERKTEMQLFYSNGSIKTGKIAIKRGIFQGDPLPSQLFCVSLVPLSNMLNREKLGYEIQKSTFINHLLYMDDLKLFAKDDGKLDQELSMVKQRRHRNGVRSR